ncbi:MAG: transposase [Pyrinomonadaceae bacterium]
MLDDHGFEIYENNIFPIAYLITLRTYGTWHHGDKRFSVGRDETNIFGSPMIQPNVPLEEVMRARQSQPPFIFDQNHRRLVCEVLTEVSNYRNYDLRAANVRSNHAHVVVSGAVKPEKIVNDFKVYATRRLRDKGVVSLNRKIWSRGASTRYLWKPNHVMAAIDYVLYCQEGIPFEFREG